VRTAASRNYQPTKEEPEAPSELKRKGIVDKIERNGEILNVSFDSHTLFIDTDKQYLAFHMGLGAYWQWTWFRQLKYYPYYEHANLIFIQTNAIDIDESICLVLLDTDQNVNQVKIDTSYTPFPEDPSKGP